jgi:cytochrome c553
MKTFLLGIVVSSALIGCTDTSDAPAKPTAEKFPASDIGAGKVVAKRDCRTCHGLDGRGVAPAIPHLAAQREPYMLASVKEYAQGRRTHAALRDLMGHLSEAEVRNVVAYYAIQAPVANAAASEIRHSSPYEQGRKHAAACAKCHSEDGNSRVPGTPTLAGQQPHYLAAAIQEYHQGNRTRSTMRSMLRDSDRLEVENLALYFAAQTPVRRSAPSRGDSAPGEPLSAKCGGCHGSHGVSTDAATPSLAGQDFEYLVKAISSYRTSRRNWGMQRYVAGLGDRDIENIAAFYAVQRPKAADKVPSSTQELAEKCDHCHDRNDDPAMAAPKLRGQDKDYLVMALRAYRDGRRESSTMHNMSFPYSNAIIESLATWYAGEPAK